MIGEIKLKEDFTEYTIQPQVLKDIRLRRMKY